MSSDQDPIDDFFAIVPAGGAGTRLWPLSRAQRPKFLLDLFCTGRSLLQDTVSRVAPLVGPEGTYVVTGAEHVAAVTAQLESPGDRVLAEPSPRDSMAAIGLAVAVIHHRHGRSIVGSFAADHKIAGAEQFQRAMRQAVAAARADYLVTIGIAASRPSTAFGYIHSGAPAALPGAPEACHVVGFTEKPDARTAQRYLGTGEYRWNAGMFVVASDVLLRHLGEQRPAMLAGLQEIASAWDTPRRAEAVARIWPTLDRVAIDHALAEPVAAAGGVVVIPGHFGWDDVGDFNSLAALLPSVDGAGNKVLGDDADVLHLEVAGSVIAPASGRLITVLGLDDVVVVDTPDALLVTTRARAQQVKDVVGMLKERGREAQT